MSLKIDNVRLQPHLQGANVITHWALLDDPKMQKLSFLHACLVLQVHFALFLR